MNRILFEEREIAPDGTAVFEGPRAVHVVNVLHGSVGQVLKTGVVNGPIGTSTVTAVEGPSDAPRVTVRVRHDRQSLAPWCDLLLAMPRPRVFKRLLPQLAAMGVGKIVLVGAEKVEKCYWSADCLADGQSRPQLIDGLMQGGTSILPTLRVERNFVRYLRDAFESEFARQPLRYLAHPDASASTPRSFVAPSSRKLVAIGPEGGWTDAELALLEGHGFARVSLGPRILKTETAAVALLAVLGLVEDCCADGNPRPTTAPEAGNAE